MYFLALVAPRPINEEVLKWKQYMKDRFGCSVALRSPAHITLIPPFWMEHELEKLLEEKIKGFSLTQSSIEIQLKNFGAFAPRVIYVDVLANQSLQSLHLQLREYLVTENTFPVKKGDRPFHPHVTIAARDIHKKAFYEAWEIFKNRTYEAAWMAAGISLLRHNQKNWDVVFTSQFSN